MFRYGFILKKAWTELLEKRSLCSLVNFVLHVVPWLPIKLQKSSIDRAWEGFERLVG